MLPEHVQRCQLARYLSGMRDASVLPAWLLVGRDLREMMGICVKLVPATGIHMLVTQLCLILCNPMDCSLPGLCPWDFPGKNTGMGCHFLLLGIFPTQGLTQGIRKKKSL